MNVTDTELTHAEALRNMERPPRPEKVAEVERLEAILRGSAAVYLTDYRGINVEMMNDLRRRFRDAGVEFTIVKNTLLKRAADGAELPEWIADMEGQTALAIGVEDPVAPARVIKDFQDEFRRQADFLVFKAGLLQGEMIEQDTFQKLATLPGREELIARLLYLLTWPLRGLVTVLSGLPRNLVFALEDLRSKRAEAEPAAPGPDAGTDDSEVEAEAEAAPEAAAEGADIEAEDSAAEPEAGEAEAGTGTDETSGEGDGGNADPPEEEKDA
jgi:large subunit ribosomal protein L10